MTYPFSFLITIADFMKISKKISAYIKVTLISLFKFTKHLNAAFENDARDIPFDGRYFYSKLE